MRGASTSIGRRIPSSDAFFASPGNHSVSLIPFSTSSGRGRGSGPAPGSIPTFDFPNNAAPGKVEKNYSLPSQSPQSQQTGVGHGRGKPLDADSVPPALSSFLSSIKFTQPAVGRGNGSIPSSTPPKVAPSPVSKTDDESQKVNVKQEFRDDISQVSAAGRGKPLIPIPSVEKVNEMNRHIRIRETQEPKKMVSRNEPPRYKAPPYDSQDNAPKTVKGQWRKEMKLERESRPMGSRKDTKTEDEKDKIDPALEAEYKTRVKQLTKCFGDDFVNELEQIVTDCYHNASPTLYDEEIDKIHTNYSIDFEPEYLMDEFNQNPDIEEKPPMPLQTFIDKIKPFMIEYMQIQTPEEWEDAERDLHKKVPLMKEIVDYYSGPDRITAKEQEDELVKLTKGVPSHTPIEMKDFVDRAVISLQGNPGWKFDKKCQFMNKLVREVAKYR